MMKASSTHFVFKDQTDYKDIAPVFPDILKLFLVQTEQMPEDEEVLAMFIELNMYDLERNRKPEGYNRKGRMRMVFPTDRKEFYIRTLGKSTEVTRLGEKISAMLSSAGVEHTMTQNEIMASN
jgi:hypothetical protein